MKLQGCGIEGRGPVSSTRRFATADAEEARRIRLRELAQVV